MSRPPLTNVIERTFQASYTLRVYFTERVFHPTNPVLANVFASADGAVPARVLAVLDQSVSRAFAGLAQQIETYFADRPDRRRLSAVMEVEGGERAKNSPALVSELLSRIERERLDRKSFVLAIGGGALLDVAGLAAATAHRGIRLIRLPTTTLSQADSGVGVKNGINALGKKNFVGTFAPPYAVINDFEWLTALEDRDKRGGYAEAVKVALVQDGVFFEALESEAGLLRKFDPAAMRR